MVKRASPADVCVPSSDEAGCLWALAWPANVRAVRVYQPTIVDGEQRFAANIIAVEDGLIALGDLLPKPGKALQFGTPIHSLLIHLDGAQTWFELNDQGNTRDTSDVERLELTPTTLRIVFAAGRGPYSGRVSLSPEIEIFDRDAHQPQQVRSVLVEMHPTTTQLARIKQLLAGPKLVNRVAVPSPRRAREKQR
jgi:hypothetical protein